MPPREPIEAYIAKRVDVTATGCWEWKLARNQFGYGYCFRRDWMGYAHRFTYTHLAGPIDDGLFIDHLCRNPPCVNPDHLEPVTHQENMRRGQQARRGTNYALYQLGDGRWCAASDARSENGTRRRKSFRMKDRDRVVASMEAWLATLDD